MEIKLNSNEEGKRLDIFISENTQLSRSFVKELIKKGLVTLNGTIPKTGNKIKINDEIYLSYENRIPEILPQNIPLDIVYEDEFLLVINKKKGMVVHPAPGNYQGTLVNALLYHCKNLSGINGVLRPGIVHRIDKDTSGLLVVAKKDTVHRDLAKQLAAHKISREYIALTYGDINEKTFTIDKPIGRDPKDRKKMAVVYTNSKRAVTHAELIDVIYKNDCKLNLIKAILETGRTHQIRVHMAYRKNPVAGDNLYGSAKKKLNQKLNIEGQALHARSLAFVHPVKNELMSFSSSVPEYFKEISGREIY